MWSFGAVLFHILCGHPPYMGRGDDRGAQMLRNIMTTEADFDLLRDAGVSEEGIDFIAKLLNRDPKSRPTEAECFQHAWLANVPDEFDYMEVDGTTVPEVNRELDVVAEVNEEEELDASALEINDDLDDDFFQRHLQPEQSNSSSGPVNVKRQRVDEQTGEYDAEQVVMTQAPSVEIRYPSLPQAESWELNPSMQYDNPASSVPRLFGEIPDSAMRSSNVFGDALEDKSLDLPEFQEPQQRDESFTDWSSSFEHASGIALSLDTAAQTHHELLRPSNFGLTASSLMGAESMVGQLNMESFTSQPPLSTDPNSENATSPEQEADIKLDNAEDQHVEPSHQEETPQQVEFSRRIELEPHPSLSSQGSHGTGNAKSQPGSMNSSRRESRSEPANEQIESEMAAELARTIDERTGNEVPSFAQQEVHETDIVHHTQPPETEAVATDLPKKEKKTETFIRPPRLLGKLIPVPGSIFKETIRLESRMTSWGRGMNTTVRYPDPMDSRIPSYALELTFWAPCIESRIAEGKDWTTLPDVVTILSTKTSKCIWVNDVELRSETPAKDAYLFGRVYTGDIITVYRSKDQSVRFRCEFYHGESMKTRAEAEGAQTKFVIEKAKKVRAPGMAKTTNVTLPTTAGSTMTSSSMNVSKGDSDFEKLTVAQKVPWV